MGTHPIFESDFDCLTENMDKNMILVLGVTGAGKSILIRRLEDQDTFDFASRPTRGAEPKRIGAFTFLEVGGELAPLWATYSEDAKAILDLKSTCALPIVLYIRSAASPENARVLRDAYCLREFDFIQENGTKQDMSSILKFCHQTNKV